MTKYLAAISNDNIVSYNFSINENLMTAIFDYEMTDEVQERLQQLKLVTEWKLFSGTVKPMIIKVSYLSYITYMPANSFYPKMNIHYTIVPSKICLFEED